jgi:hypothetical protein
MKLALGKMRMTPDEFWNCSFVEFIAACDGFIEFNSDGKPPPLSKNELEELMELHPD